MEIDEKTVLIHDLWMIKNIIEDAQYRADSLALRDEVYKRYMNELSVIWHRLDDMRWEILDGKEHEAERQETCR